MSIAILLLLGLILASLPMMGERSLMAVPVLKSNKSAGVRVLEFILAYVVWIVIARIFEAQVGQVNKQDWEFYTVTFLLFVIAAFPAFSWRYLWLRA